MNPTDAISRASLISSLLASTLGAVLIAGWYLRIPFLLQVHPGFAPTPYNAALGLLLGGLAVFCLHISRPRIAQIIGIVLLLLGALTLWEHLTGLDLHIDQFFIQHILTVNTSTPGRMAPSTALCFLLGGVNLLARTAPLSPKMKANANGVLAPVIIAVAGIGLISYAFEATADHGWSNFARMETYSAIGFIVLGFAFYGVRESEIQNRSRLPYIGIALLVFVLSLWQVLENREVSSLRNQVQQRADQLRTALLLSLEDDTRLLKRLAARWEREGGLPLAEWQKEGSSIENDTNVLVILRYAADSQTVWTASGSPMEKNVAASLPPGLCQTPVSAPRMLIQNLKIEPMLVEVTPLQIAGRDDGCIVVVMSLSRELQMLRNLIGEIPYDLTVVGGDGQTAYQEADGTGKWHAETLIQDRGLDLRLRLTPSEKQLASGVLPKIVLVSCTALIVLLLLYWLRVARANEQKARELQARAQRELSLRRRVIENSPHGILLINQEGGIDLVNVALYRLFGYSADELIGQPIKLLVPNEEALQKARKHHADSEDASARTATDNVIMGRHRDGRLIPIELNFAPIDGNAQAGEVAMVIDVSERIKAQRLIEEQVNELTRINEELNNFTYVASHDLKSPLRGIEQLASWLIEDMGDDLSPETQNHLRLMRSRIGRMEMLLDDLLAYSRVGRTNDEIVTVNTGALVKEIFEMAGTTKRVHTQISEDLPVLQTRKVPLELVFRNLISNAIKHLDKPEGAVSVSVRSMADAVEFSVRDNGPGIAPIHQQRVFGMFQTLKPRDEVEGSGIGLALVKKAVESVGGRVSLESDGRNGCTFFFTWPTTITRGYLT